MSLLQELSKIIELSDSLQKQLNHISQQINISKGKLLVNVNERSDTIYFINKGLLRGYYFDDGKEITNWFAQENEFATCFYSFITDKFSYENIYAVEDCELIGLSSGDLKTLYEKFPETERVGRIITENYYIRLEERVLNLQFKSAKERYEKLVKSKPTLLQRAPLGHIASYLGITHETLSRIRAEV